MKTNSTDHQQPFNLFCFALTAAVLAFAGTGCSDSPAPQPGTAAQATTLFDKYGGLPGVQKIVDDSVSTLLSDCTQNPYFTTVLGTPGHITEEQLKACLDLQLSAALGAPGVTYPGRAAYRNPPDAQGWECRDMVTIHTGLGIPPAVFDQFIVDVAAVMRTNGVTDADLAMIAPALVGLKPQIVAPEGQEQTFSYTPDNPPGNGCTQTPQPGIPATPVPATAASPAPAASPAATPLQ